MTGLLTRQDCNWCAWVAGTAWHSGLAKDGALFFPAAQTREGASVGEGLIFRVTGV
jgi:hypothetical protein